MKRLDEFWQYYEWMLRFNERDANLNGGQGVVTIVDFDEFRLAHYASKNGKRGAWNVSGSKK